MQQRLAVQTPAADSCRLLGVDGSGRSLGLLRAGVPCGTVYVYRCLQGRTLLSLVA